MSRPDETTSAFDRTWEEVARASDPDPRVDSIADDERDDADPDAVAPEQPDAAIQVTPALDPVALASIIANRAPAPTDTTGSPLTTAIPGSVPPGSVPIDEMMRASDAARTVDASSTQAQPDSGTPTVGGGEPSVPWVDTANTSSIPRPEAAETAHQNPTMVRPSVSPVNGDASRASQPSVEVSAQGDVAEAPSALIGDGASAHNGLTDSGERASGASSDGAGHGERNGIHVSDTASIRPALDGAMVEWNEAAAPSAVGGADQVVTTADTSLRAPTDAVMRTVTRSMVEQVHALRTDGAHAWSVQLEPDEFGSVRVQILVQDQGVTADVLTGHPLIRDLFQQHQGELRQALADAGLRVDRLSVSVDDAGQQPPNRSWDSGRESRAGREQAPGWTAQRVEPTAAATGWTAWADVGVRHAVNVYV